MMEVERRVSVTTTATATPATPASVREAAMTAASAFHGRRAAIVRRASISVDRTRSGVDASHHHATASPSSPSSSASPQPVHRRRMSHALPMAAIDQHHLQWLKRQRRESIVYLQWDWEEHRSTDRLCAMLASQLSLSRKKSTTSGSGISEPMANPSAFLLPGQEECVLEDAPTMEGSS